MPSAPGGTSRRPQRPSARRRGRRAPVSPRRPSPRMRPLRGPRCRRRRRSTSWRFLLSSCPLDAATMLRRTGETDGDALREFYVHMPGMRRRSGQPANREVRRPGASFGLDLDGGRIGRRGRSVARMLRSRHATIPEGVGRTGYERQKLGGGARASPPHKTLSGFDIQLQYTRSEPAINQLGEEFHGCLRRGIGAGDGEHGPDVIGKGAEPCRRLACECGPLGHALV